MLKLDLVGKKFSRLTVVQCLGTTDKGKVSWLCQCECGNMKEVRSTGKEKGYQKLYDSIFRYGISPEEALSV